jgi:alanine dehydrogenase
VIVDVAIDQGGCVETIHETTHADPVYEVHGVLHYAVGNIPGGVPHTSTYALTNATLPYVLALATQGPSAAIKADAELAGGVNTCDGHVTNAAVAAALDQIETTARGTDNLLPPMKEALRAGATLGEVSDALRRVFGEHRQR